MCEFQFDLYMCVCALKEASDERLPKTTRLEVRTMNKAKEWKRVEL